MHYKPRRPRILNLINKKINVENVIDLNRKLSQLPIKIRYNFIVGFPTETKGDIDSTLKLMDQLRDENPNMEPPFLNIYTPYPGTPLYKIAIANGLEEPQSTIEWSHFKWNSFSGKWLNTEVSEHLISLSKRFYENSYYLKYNNYLKS